MMLSAAILWEAAVPEEEVARAALYLIALPVLVWLGARLIFKATHVRIIDGLEPSRQQRFINAFEQTGREVAVEPQGDIKHLTTNLVDVPHPSSASLLFLLCVSA